MELLRRAFLLGSSGLALASHPAYAILFSGAAISGGGGGSTLTTATLLTTDGTNIPANTPFEFGLMVAPGSLNTPLAVQVEDSVGNILGIQEDNRGTDINSNDRILKVTGVLPTAPGASNTTITIKTVAGSPVTSNPITVANVLAQTIAGETFEWKVTGTLPNGDVYTALASDALNGSSTWTYGSPQNRGTFRSGPYCTEWICSAPMMHAGSPHPFWNIQFHIAAYKALPGPWNASTNPITGVKILRIAENGYVDVAGGADLQYDLLDQVGSTLTTYLQLDGSTPVANLTFLQFPFVSGSYNSGTGQVTLNVTGSTVNSGDTIAISGAAGTGSFASINGTFVTGPGTDTNSSTIVFTIATGLTMTLSGATISKNSGLSSATRSAGTWGAANTTTPNAQDCGKAIIEIGGNGRGYITGLNSSTSISISIPTNTAFTGTSKTSTNWRIMGVYHPYMMRVDNYGSGHGYSTIGWWGTPQKAVAALPLTYIKNSLMVLNYGANASSVTPDLTNCNQDGSHPMGVHFPINASIKNFGMDEASTGDVNHVGVLSFSFCSALMNWGFSSGQHLNARQLCFQNSRVGNLKPFWLRDSSHGGCISIDQAGIYYHTGQSNDGLAMDDYQGAAQFYGFATNHSGDTSYLPYLLSGDFMHLENLATAANDYSLRTSAEGIMTGTNTSVTIAGSNSASIALASGYPQQTGEAVIIVIGGYFPQIGGGNISRSNCYYVRKIDATHINLYLTHAQAVAGGAPGLVLFSSGGSGITVRNGYGKSTMPGGVAQNQPRAQAWNDRSISHLAMVMPTVITPGLIDYSRTRANVQRQYNVIGTFMKTTYADDSNFQAGGPRFLGMHDANATGKGGVYGPWQNNYYRLALKNSYEGGVQGANHITFMNWFCADSIQWAVNSVNESPYFMTGDYYTRAQTNSGVIQYTYPGVYQEAMRAPINAISYGRWNQASQSATISSIANQAAVSITLALTSFDTVNPSRHIGSWIKAGVGCGQITSITDGFTCVADATVSVWDGILAKNANFATGAGQAVTLSFPSWGNASSIVGSTRDYSHADKHYMWLANSGIEIANDLGIDPTNYAAAASFMSSTMSIPANPVSFSVVNDPTTGCSSALKANVIHR